MKTKKNESTPSRDYIEIRLPLIDQSPYQTRTTETGIEELAASIKTHGIICPVTVRPMGARYELIAGHRRVAAASVAGLERIPAIVMNDCTDSEAAEMCVTENMQRCDLTPLEEAQGVKALLDTGHTAQDVADRLGRSRQWVARRANLLNLCDDVREAVEDASHPMSLAPVAGLEMIATMPEATQIAILKEFAEDSGFPPTLANIERVIGEQMRDLDTAPFDIGQCEHCLKRTSVQPDLFDIDEKASFGRCLDEECFEKKRKEKMQQRIAEIRKNGEDTIIVSDDYMLRRDFSEVWPTYEFKPAKKGEQGAILAFKLDKNTTFERIWLKPFDRGSGASLEADAPKQPTPEQKAHAKTCRYVAHLLDATIVDGKPSADNPFAGRAEADIMRIVMVTGTNDSNRFSDPLAWEKLDQMTFGQVEDALWAVVKPVLFARVNYMTIIRCENAFQEALAIAKHVFGITAEAVCEQAAAWNEK